MFKITETPNKYNLDVGKVAMTCDDDGHKVPPPLQRGNFFYIVVGQPASGKTNLVMNLILRKKCFYYKQFHKIYIFSASLHTIKQKIKLPKEQLVHGFDIERLSEIIQHEKEEAEEDDEKNKIHIIFDDVVSQIAKNLKPMLHLLYNRRHIGGGISVILTTQKLTKVPLELRTVASALFFFNTRNKQETETLYDEYVGFKKPQLKKVLDFVFDKPHNFLFLNFEKRHDEMYHKNFNELSFVTAET